MAIPTRLGVDPRKIRPADRLNRRVVALDTENIAKSIEGKVVLVTGAGGTIGAELSRQIAAYRPKKLLLLENNATALFYSQGEMSEINAAVEIVGALGDVRDGRLVEAVLAEHRPNTVFHAAAHKHVHQLESNVSEGVSNNLLGTYHLALAAERHGVQTFVLISTDKAVRPRCVMGATKRAAEVVLSSLARASATRFVSVRFGNVLGSSGSVLKIFQEQLEKGAPITISHPDAARYFMTVEEAVGLVLQAMLLAKGGEIYMLKMGQPVRIMDLADRLIRMAGLEPGRDVPIRVVGLKPGEKVAEELIEDIADVEQSTHPEILVVRGEDGRLDEVAEMMAKLDELCFRGDKKALIRSLERMVPTYTPDPVHGGVPPLPAPDIESQHEVPWAETN